MQDLWAVHYGLRFDCERVRGREVGDASIDIISVVGHNVRS